MVENIDQRIKTMPKWFWVAAIGVVAFGLYISYERSKATTASNTGTAGNASVPGEIVAAQQSTGADQQALIDQLNNGLSQLFTPIGNNLTSLQTGVGSLQTGVTGLNQGVTTLGQNVQTGFAAQTAAQTQAAQQIQQQLAATQQAILQAQQQGDTATVNALQAQSTALQKSLTDLSNANASGLNALGQQVGTSLSSLWSNIQTAFGGVGQSLTQGQAANAAANAALAKQLQSTQDALTELYGNINNSQYYQIGRNTIAACIAVDGNVSLNCAQNMGFAEIGYPGDTDANAVGNYIRNKYGSCMTGNTMDYVCAGKLALTTPGQHIPGH